jgi:hypothetical protein
MLIWLGKQYLGQSDRVQHEQPDGVINVTIRRTEVSTSKMVETLQVAGS